MINFIIVLFHIFVLTALFLFYFNILISICIDYVVWIETIINYYDFIYVSVSFYTSYNFKPINVT